MKTANIMGYETSAAGLYGDISEAWRILESEATGHYVACFNPHSMVEARRDGLFNRALSSADILLPDGIGIVVASKILGLAVRQRVAGSDFFLELCRQAETRGGLKYFFVGSTDTVLEKIVERLKLEFPHIEVCGVYSPPFKEELSDEDDEVIIQRVNEARPDVLWVGMTAPKQEKWIYKNRAQLSVPLIGAIGAVFDFYAGTKKRAPEWMCRIGLEWLPRLLREPKRLFKRNFISSPIFLMMVLQEKYRK